ncbi:hypothetical protein HYPSUDRAFT_526130 [Hypholoma sublateritium FD-334 SS-4]|uniref:Uncharacterized protein n=1 Tax=Hypholoma sublateritium (strain FD-334 SS-4) TaxID=945553 RepID=A0A0D2MKS7_HYPSF|nr:hypothetical protein HYPSUDRAFT_526130 [Hypholoma sublateritium FD-334 SS-4]
MSPSGTSDYDDPWPELSILDSEDKGMAIGQYCRSLHLLYKAEGSDRMEKVIVREVRLYKARKSPEHEYISAKVCVAGCLDDADSRYVLFERFKGSRSKGSFSLSSLHKSKSNPDYSDSSPAFYANDKVRIRNKPHYDDQDEVHRILSFDPPLHLYQLALLACTIHDSSDVYDMLKSNCYFYAGIFVKVLEKVFTWGALHTTGSPAVEGANSLVRKKSGKDKAGTTWLGINLAGNDETLRIIAQFDETTDNFMKAIDANEAIAKAAERERIVQEKHRAEEELKIAILAFQLEAEQEGARKAEEAQAAFALRVSAQQAELRRVRKRHKLHFPLYGN